MNLCQLLCLMSVYMRLQDSEENQNSRNTSPNNNTIIAPNYPPPQISSHVPSPPEQRRASQQNAIIQHITSNPDYNPAATGTIPIHYQQTPHVQEYYPMSNGLKGIRTNVSGMQIPHSSSVSEPGGRSNSNRVIPLNHTKQKRYNSSQNVAVPKQVKSNENSMTVHHSGRLSPGRYNHVLQHGNAPLGRLNKKRKPSSNPHLGPPQQSGGNIPAKRPQELSGLGR